jgi:phosphatidate cytidylyltransferase
VQRDESGERRGPRPGDEDPGGEWTVEDFDDFAPFDAEADDDESPTQETLDFASDTPPDGLDEQNAREPDDSPTEMLARAPWDPASAEDESTAKADEAPTQLDPIANDSPAQAAVEPGGETARPWIESAADGGDDAADGAEMEDTTEAAFEGGVAAGSAEDEDEDAVDLPDFASFTSEQYVQTTTQEFVDLAEEMARAHQEPQPQSAVSAAIPGLDSGIVGLEDMVAASGDDPSTIPVAPRSNLAARVLTGLGLAVIFFASLVDSSLVGLFMLVVLTLAAGEFYAAFMRSDLRPLGLFGVLGAVGALAGTWVSGLIAVPVAIALTLTATLLFFGLAAERTRPMLNIGITVMGTAWVGGAGAFAFEMVNAEDYGWLIVATVVSVALMDMAAYFVGRRVGRHRLAPRVSPNKTIEGLVAGMLVAVGAGIAFGLREPFDLSSGLALGLVVAGAAPFGDLAVSVLKRSLGVKDMGTLLPGHGGLLDRIDAMLFVIPFAWIVFSWSGLIV